MLGEDVAGVGFAVLPTPAVNFRLDNDTLFFDSCAVAPGVVCGPCDMARPELMVLRGDIAALLDGANVLAVDVFLEARSAGHRFLLCDPAAVCPTCRQPVWHVSDASPKRELPMSGNPTSSWSVLMHLAKKWGFKRVRCLYVVME